MIRWSYVAPRLAVVGGLLLFLGFGVDPLLRWSLIETGQSLTGAKVEIETISTSLAHSQLAARNVAVANPAAPETNLLQADYAWLDVESGPLTRNHVVVRRAVVNGLKINAPRDSSGELDDGAAIEWDGQRARAAADWLEGAARALGEGLEDDLESVKIVRELRSRWPQEYRDLEARIDAWLKEAKALEQLPDQLRGDVLQQAEQIRRATLTLRWLKEELTTIRDEFQRLHQQARLDRTDLAAAAQRDIAMIEQRLQLAKLDPAALTDYFLGPELGPQTRQMVAYVQWIRRQIPVSDVPEPARGRGIDIAFAPRQREPWLLVRSLQADGEIYWRDRPIPFAAAASNWTTQPAKLGEPATLKLKTTVPAESWIELSVDRSGLHAADRLSFVCPQLPIGSQTLGREDRLALHLPAGRLSVQADLAMMDDQISGSVKVVRRDAPLHLEFGESLGGENLAARLQQRIAAIDQVAAVVNIRGTLARPETSIASPLGEQLRAALRDALTEEIDERRAELAQRARAELDEEIVKLQDELAAGKTKVMNKLDLANEQQRLVEQLLAGAVGAPQGRLGRKLLDALDRR